jgi:hypothetical protein
VVVEMRRCVTELGFRGVFLRPNEVMGRNGHDPYYEPLWSVLEALEVPLGFHEGAGSQLRQVGEQFGANGMLKHVYCHPGGADAGRRQFLWRRHLGAPSPLARGLPGGELWLADLPAVTSGRALGAPGGCLRAGAEDAAQRVLQAPVFRVGGMR